MLLLLVLFFLAFKTLCQCQIVNPIEKPIERGRAVHVRKFAQIPNINGFPPRIQQIMAFANDLYVTTGTSGGFIYKVSPSGMATPWFNVAAAMRSNGREMNFVNNQHGGLRSVAFHPKFKKNGLFYTSLMETRLKDPSEFRYISKPSPQDIINADSVVLEWKVDKGTQRPLASSMREVLRVGMPFFDHPVKQMVFRGNLLYIGHGDGSVQSAIVGGGQNNDALGKILRVDPLRKGSKPYTVPKSNPFVKKKKNRDPFPPEVYAVGFRNPHNLCFSKKGELFVTDTGRDNVEEVNIVKAGGNYGWSLREGPFVHKRQQAGGILDGIEPLPKKDKKKLIYPSAVVGHFGPRGAGFVGQALAGACPVENGSPLKNTFLYANFPTDGALYYSFLKDMRKARTTGKNSKLTQATTYQANILYDHDNNPNTPPLNLPNLRAVVQRDPGLQSISRVDMRFGQGKDGEIYFSSKRNGRIYLISSTLPGFSE